jgi:hypothetical protein
MYSLDQWNILLSVLVIIGLLAFIFTTSRRYKDLNIKILQFDKRSHEMQQLFNEHFKVVDKTICEERKEKQYWKKRYEALEKELDRQSKSS